MKKTVIVLSLLIIFTKVFGDINSYRKGNLVIENIPEIPSSLVKKLTFYHLIFFKNTPNLHINSYNFKNNSFNLVSQESTPTGIN